MQLRMTNDYLHGLPAWKVFRGAKLIGYVLSRDKQGRIWAAFIEGDDIYDDLMYVFTTRRQALKYLDQATKESA